MIVVADAPEAVRFIEAKLGVTISPPYQAFGYMADDGRGLAAVVVNDYNGANCELTIVADKGGFTRSVLHHIASHVFNKLGCRRATVRTKKSNKPLLRAITRYGFTYENVARHFYHDDDAVVFRMLRDECRWIKQ